LNALQTELACSITEAEEVVRQELAGVGFGVLTEIDVAAVLHEKLGVSRPAMKILGACNPQLAHRALEVDQSVGLLLPCNIVLEAAPGGTRVSAADPLDLMPGPALGQVALDARGRLESVMAGIAAEIERRAASSEVQTGLTEQV
jgi:uncharacterized protein (DUF302 family)